MIHGKPCLTHYSESGANASPETIGPAGLFAKDITEYIEYLYILLRDTTFREKLASKSRPHAEEYFSINKCIDQATYIYNKILGFNDGTDSKNKTIPYYYSDIGFIYASNLIDLKNEDDIAYKALVGGIPRELECEIITLLTEKTKNTFVDINPGDALFSWVVSKRFGGNVKTLILSSDNQGNFPEILKTIYLNNWEDRIEVMKVNSDLKIQNSLVRIGNRKIISDTLNIQSIISGKNIVFIDNKEEKEPYLKLFKENNYLTYLITNNKVISAKEIRKTFLNVIAIPVELKEYELEIEKVVKVFKFKNYYFGFINKEAISRKIRKIIPPYFTAKRINQYLKRKTEYLKSKLNIHGN